MPPQSKLSGSGWKPPRNSGGQSPKSPKVAWPTPEPVSLALFPPPEQLAPISLRYLVDWVDLGRAFSTGAVVSTLIAILPSSNFLWQWSGFWFGAAIGLVGSVLESEGLYLFAGGSYRLS